MFTEIHRQVRPDGRTHEYQFRSTKPRQVNGYGNGAVLTASLRFDDQCRNGYDVFALTGDVMSPKKRGPKACGSLHDEIARVFPELEPLIKWHLCSTKGPMYYVSNTVYFAGDRDHWGPRAGEPHPGPVHQEAMIQFDDVPIRHVVKPSLAEFIRGHKGQFDVVAVPHPRDPKTFSPSFCFQGMAALWHLCPFDREQEAHEFAAALNTCRVTWSSRPTLIGEGKPRDLDAARRAAIWPDATDEDLTAEPSVLKAKLAERLPDLLQNFRAAMESVGFTWLAE